MKTGFRPIVFAALLACGSAWAAGDPGSDQWAGPAPSDPVLQKVADATRARDWPRAAAILREALAKSPDNAEYHNLYAYSLRKGPNPDMDEVFRHYEIALRLDPDNRNAHEYVGEAYLMVGRLDKAKGELAVLDRLCTLPCEQYSELKEAIGKYEATRAK